MKSTRIQTLEMKVSCMNKLHTDVDNPSKWYLCLLIYYVLHTILCSIDYIMFLVFILCRPIFFFQHCCVPVYRPVCYSPCLCDDYISFHIFMTCYVVHSTYPDGHSMAKPQWSTYAEYWKTVFDKSYRYLQ